MSACGASPAQRVLVCRLDVRRRGWLSDRPGPWLRHVVQIARIPAADRCTFAHLQSRRTLTEHAVTVIGVRPDAVLINDPWFGRAWRPKTQFESACRTFDGMAVIVGSSGLAPANSP